MVPSGAIAGATLIPGRWGPHGAEGGRKLGLYALVESRAVATPGHGSRELPKAVTHEVGAVGTRAEKLTLLVLSSGAILTSQLPSAFSEPTDGFAGSKSSWSALK